MPALKRETKLGLDCAGGGHSLRVCHKSTKISKGSLSQVKTSQQAEVLETSIQIPQDVFSNIKVSGQKTEISDVGDCQDTFSEASAQFLKLSMPQSDSAFIGNTGSLPATCPSILETIFSPIFGHDEVLCKPVNQSNAVREEEHPDLPHLVNDDSDDGCSSNDCQTGNASDVYIFGSDVGSPFDGNMEFSDIMTPPCHDYDYMDPDTTFDTGDMILPFLEKTVETSHIHAGESVEEAVMNFDDVCLYLAIHQMKPSDQVTDISYHHDDPEDVEYLDPQLFIRNFPDLSEAVSSIWLPKETWIRKSITLVLDLDETLVHSTLERCADADFTFPVFFNMKMRTVYVRRRPHLQMFLERVAQMFEIVIFTASQSFYAEQLLDILDPDRTLISQRIFRESCIFSDGNYTKDLTILGIDLAKVAIIDNSPQVFQLQVNNGIPIKSWFDDPSDHALISLLPFLETLVDADDVRPLIAGRFSNKEL